MPNAVIIDTLSKTYRPRAGASVTAVDRVSLTLPEGAVVGLLGAHGAGKTTAIKLVGGLLRPTGGRVTLWGYDTVRDREMALQQRGVLLSTERYPQQRRSVRETLLQAGRRMHRTQRELVSAVDRLLDDYQLAPLRDLPVHLLRPVEQRIVALSLALLADPPIVLLDEPTAGLDGSEARFVLSALRRSVKTRTVLLATSHVAIAGDLCDRIALLNDGRLSANLAAEELRASLRHPCYEIRVKGHLSAAGSDWFDGFTIRNLENGEAVIAGAIADQAALHGVLARAHALNLPLIEVRAIEPNVHDLFAHLRERA